MESNTETKVLAEPHNRTQRAEDREEQYHRRRQNKDRKTQKQVRGFMEAFSGAGLDEDRLENVRSVANARKIVDAGRKTSEAILKVNTTVNGKLKTQSDKLIEKTEGKMKKLIDLPDALMVGLMTFSVALEAMKGMIKSVAEGFVEAVMKVAGGLSDALHERYREKFGAKNDIQEIAIALIMFFAFLVSSISQLLSGFFSILKNTLVEVIENFFGEEMSKFVFYIWDILFQFIQIQIIMSLVTLKRVIIIAIVLTVLSFCLKMDDMDEDEFETLKAKKSGKKEEPASSTSDSQQDITSSGIVATESSNETQPTQENPQTSESSSSATESPATESAASSSTSEVQETAAPTEAHVE
ncbi:uncharacterized protein MONOS_17312 [Monocercomonoides exilis]|uniref:uncharacterized protein n=1 Tax=Monocercomonoides exilis TaxID=2049356 RepID=UPI00355A3A27|nr:hypothetical protein MONOS_17312 [Monocercomonoides exilis]